MEMLSEEGDKEPDSTRFNVADLVGQLQRTERPLKESIEKCDVLFSKKRMDSFTQQLCKQEVEKEQKHFQEFIKVFRSLDDRTQKPYMTLVRKYKLKVDRHQQLEAKIEDDPSHYKSYIETKKELWEEQFEDESRLVFYGRGILGVLGAFMLHLLIGAIYRWAMVNAYISSYYKITNNPYITTSIDSVGAPLSMLAVGFTMKPALKIGMKTGKIPLIICSVLMLAASTLISSFMPTFFLFLLFHNILYGLSAGMIFLTSMSECQKYFSEWRLYINSIILVGTGLGGVLFGVLNIKCMNPQDLSPASSGYFSGELDYIAFMLPYCLRNMSIYVLVIGVLGWVALIPLLRYNSNEVVIEHRIKTRKNFEFICMDENEALKSPIFWKIALIVVLSSAGNFFMTMNYKNIPSSTIHNMQFLNLVVLSGAVANGLFRFLWGISLQRFGFKWVFLVAMVLNIFCFAFTPIAIKYYATYITIYSISGAVIGGLMVLMPNLCLMVFGDLVGNQVFGYIWLFFTISNFLQYLIGVTLSHVAHSSLILLFMGTSAVALVVGSLTTYQGKWDNSLHNLTF